MKKALALFCALMVVVTFSACKAQQKNKPTQLSADASGSDMVVSGQETSNMPTEQLISKQRAIEIALQEAKLDAKSVTDLEAELDRERSVVVWEVDFETLEHEYSYDITAYDGSVAKADREKND